MYTYSFQRYILDLIYIPTHIHPSCSICCQSPAGSLLSWMCEWLCFALMERKNESCFRKIYFCQNKASPHFKKGLRRTKKRNICQLITLFGKNSQSPDLNTTKDLRLNLKTDIYKNNIIWVSKSLKRQNTNRLDYIFWL